MKEKENKISAGKKTWESYDQWGKYKKRGVL
ncbi:hypothetical protein UC3_01183 [Enterococcus phoeniculicola ATCC BAA-412]|jgi:hypothetical protein|uniref:Uncharacterized protein n=1 Tax=Enterococcus phoeniculicola ATCC BAA-412 TaxID=1158610 RepID=R3TVW4_9ENTE|nr:hypothetical protein UC3_01183 [Enterococcus phoeniculicola ATCC BAA-412]EOT74655.1 hypothetical protein I589_02255 [Enterococcus phoeniculicola ATCC BAA-412]